MAIADPSAHKIRTVEAMFWAARAVHLVTLRSLHPAWSEEQLQDGLRRAMTSLTDDDKAAFDAMFCAQIERWRGQEQAG